ncbi:hypothetical protein F5887DRAFT_299834 [Amanita rubescens]|nr:hypothetical protein F5887DRAFT_299834 [Amanita rubescens]
MQQRTAPHPHHLLTPRHAPLHRPRNLPASSARHAVADAIHASSDRLRGFSGLPPEIVGYISIFACDSGYLSPHNGDSEQLQLTLQLVCKKWGQIISTTSRLWNVLDLKISLNNEQDFQDSSLVSLTVADSMLRRAESWLQRAGNSPIVLDLLVDPCIEAETAELCGQIFNFLSVYKFEKLSIVTFVPSILDLNKYVESLYHVRRLSLKASSPFPRRIRLLSDPLPLHSLTHLLLDVELDCSYTNLVSAFPWRQLYGLILVIKGHPDSAPIILRQCTSLVDCTISTGGAMRGSMTFTERLEDINFPCLQRLIIDNHVIGPVTNDIVQSIVAQKLESLKIFCMYRSSASIYNAVEIMAKRSGFQDGLRRLVLRNLRSAASLGKMLKLMPSLSTLQLCRTTVSDETLRLLSDGSLGPRLERVRFSECSIKPDALLDAVQKRMIKARTGDMTSFTHVSLRIISPVTDEQQERATYLQEDYGVEITLSGSDIGSSERSNDSFSGANEDEEEDEEAEVVSDGDSDSNMEE